MAITNYGELKAAIANWVHRGDLTARIPEFIALGEVRIADVVRGRLNTTTAAGTSTGKTIPLPSDYVEMRALWLTIAGVERPLGYLTPQQYAQQSLPTGDVSGYTVLGTDILLASNPSGGNQTYTLAYYKKFAALAVDSDTNTLLQRRPGLYLYAALLEVAPYIEDAPYLAVWEQKFRYEQDWVNNSDNGAASMRVRADNGV